MKTVHQNLNYSSNDKYEISSSLSKISLPVIIILSLFLMLFGQPILAQVAGEWKCFHGPDRTNKSGETGLLKKWPESGPELLWTVSGLSEGYSSVSIAKGMIFTAGKSDNQTFVFAYDINGKLVWKKPNGKA